MKYEKAKIIAQGWVDSNPKPKELKPNEVRDVLIGLGFTSLGDTSKHTTTRWKHSCLMGSPYFGIPVLSVSVGHSKGGKTVIRKGSIASLLRALQLYLGGYDG